VKSAIVSSYPGLEKYWEMERKRVLFHG
jgi:hypothetical protein